VNKTLNILPLVTVFEVQEMLISFWILSEQT